MQSIKKLTVYLGSSGRCRPIFKDVAKEMGTMIGTRGKELVYGGMDAGLMGIVANNALAAGARVTGIIPKSLKDSERIHPNLSQTILVPDLWERKLKMFQRADAIVALAGGFGTIDELLEALYWADLGAHTKPVAIVNTDGYWDDFIDYIKTLPDLRQDYLIVANAPGELFDRLDEWVAPESRSDETNTPHFEGEILDSTEAPLIFDTPSVKDGYFLATALGLKQLGKHHRPIGILNTEGQFDAFLRWINTAKSEKFLTEHCAKLFDVAPTLDGLQKKLALQGAITINLHEDKWGPSETKTHIEIKETK